MFLLHSFHVSRQEISTVTYMVSCRSGACVVERLVAPSRARLEESLGNAGHTLYSRAEPIEDDKVEAVMLLCCYLRPKNQVSK